ncbi:PIG-L deacetylase family protein [Sulfobacillus harzensis]|uniref:PIG-L family deacetylase n=1 Tax=Sulfobacillus harzensis TaxID=2729629 RepID=A0A7Y0L0P8_9FIRM|nr:PIG-L deacetylase family protein [Sulfobacillus harzensis]NMP21132.1 PIG-L family deacetylase [Sulfobacillus harzensis]
MTSEQIRALLNLPDMLDVPSALVVEPHPDDNEVGAGGTIKKLTERGCHVVYFTATDGRAGSEDPSVTAEDMVRIRMAERQQASAILGVEGSYNLGFEDGGSWSERDLMLTLVPILRQFRPALVMTVDPWAPYESHPDHVKTGRAVAAALIYAKNGVVLKGQGDPYEVPQIAFYGSAWPNVFVDVTETWESKLAALQAHRSQFDTPLWPMLSAYFGAEAEQLYHEQIDANRPGKAEAFKLLASMQMHFFPEAMRS